MLQQKLHGGRRLRILRRHQQRGISRLSPRVHVRSAIHQQLGFFEIRLRQHQQTGPAGFRGGIRIEPFIEQRVQIARRAKQRRFDPRLGRRRSSLLQLRDHRSRYRGQRQRQCPDRPRRAHRGNELIVAVGKLRFKILWAHRRRRTQPRFHLPRTIRRLRPDQKLDAAPPRRIGSSRGIRFGQRDQCLAGRIRIARQPLARVPSAVGLLRRHQRASRAFDLAAIASRPRQTEYLHRPFLGGMRLNRRQPVARPIDAGPRFGSHPRMTINLNGARGDRRGRDRRVRLRRPHIEGVPMAVGFLARRDQSRVDRGGQAGPHSRRIGAEQRIPVGDCGIDDMRVLHRAIEIGQESECADRGSMRQLFIHRDAVLARGAKRQRRQQLVVAGNAVLRPRFLRSLQQRDGLCRRVPSRFRRPCRRK